MRKKIKTVLILIVAVCFWQIGYAQAPSIKEGNILHCFDWSYADIQASLQAIKDAGFTAVQTSPAQANYTGSTGWNTLYRPRDSKVGPNSLGTRAQLQSLCTEAHKLGLFVIVDVVANHTDGSLQWVADFWKDTSLYHTYGGVNNWNDRYQVTHGELGMKDLKTEDTRVQEKFKAYVQDLKAVGVDGCRWDAAKHIGLPSEGDNFFSAVIDKSMFNYGEILDNTGGDDSKLMPEYQQFMSITDSPYSINNVLGSAKNGQATPYGGGNYTFSYSSDKVVYWGESHDTYCNANGASRGVSQEVVDRAYAVAASHNGIPALYFSRPNGDGPSARVPAKGSVHFMAKSVAEVNKFHNKMNGRADYYTGSGSVASSTRKGGGAVVVNFAGSGYVTVANGGGYATPGTYTDRVSGNTWTITATMISGQTDGTGIAVLYTDDNEPAPSPAATGSVDVYFIDNAGWGGVQIWAWDEANNYTGGNWSSRPAMTRTGEKKDGYDVYKWTYAGTLTTMPTQVIFTKAGDGNTRATGDTANGDMAFHNHGYYNAQGFTTVTGITSTEASKSIHNVTVYSLSGQRVASAHSLDEALSTLPRGIYISEGRKYVVR